MSITPSADRAHFVVRCDCCGFTLDLAPGDLTDGGIREMGWLARGRNEHDCPECTRAIAAMRRAEQGVESEAQA